MERLEPPTPFDEGRGEPVEQLRMARAIALGPEVVDRLDEPGAEVVLPDPVDEDPGRQRDARVDEPSGEPRPGVGDVRLGSSGRSSARGRRAAGARPGRPCSPRHRASGRGSPSGARRRSRSPGWSGAAGGVRVFEVLDLRLEPGPVRACRRLARFETGLQRRPLTAFASSPPTPCAPTRRRRGRCCAPRSPRGRPGVGSNPSARSARACGCGTGRSRR